MAHTQKTNLDHADAAKMLHHGLLGAVFSHARHKDGVLLDLHVTLTTIATATAATVTLSKATTRTTVT